MGAEHIEEKKEDIICFASRSLTIQV